MRTIVVALAAALTAGCSANVRLAASSGGGVSHASGTSVTSGATGLHVQGDSLTAALVALAIVAIVGDEAREDQPFPSFSTLYDWRGRRPVPPLAPDRRVHEQDCSKPIEDPSANLKCR